MLRHLLVMHHWCGGAKTFEGAQLCIPIESQLRNDPKNCENFMYSIHYVVPRSPTSKKDVLFHEQLLKKKIGGELNRN